MTISQLRKDIRAEFGDKFYYKDPTTVPHPKPEFSNGNLNEELDDFLNYAITRTLEAQKEVLKENLKLLKTRPVGAVASANGDVIYEVSSTMFNKLLALLEEPISPDSLPEKQ